MLRMEQMEAIKRMSRSESISTIASALNIDWKTAKKYAEMDDFNVTVETKVARARASKLDPYKPTIDRILEDEEQRRVPRKQRFTAKRMHSYLVYDLGHVELKDSYLLVQRYMRQCRQKRRRGYSDLGRCSLSGIRERRSAISASPSSSSMERRRRSIIS